MSVDSQVLEDCATQLLEAYASREPIEPLRLQVGGLSMDDAYRIQLLQTDHWASQGRRLVGHKVGLTSKVMQQQLGVSEPDFGHVYADMLLDEHVAIEPSRFLQPRIEPEIAVTLGTSLRGPGVTVADVRAAMSGVAPCLEIIDSRIRDWDISLEDTVADNASSGGVVLGRGSIGADTDLRWIGCTLLRNGLVEGTGTGAAVLDDPLRAVAWLANTVGAYGVALEEGQVVLPGSCTASVSVQPGDTFTANFGALGTVTVVFAPN